MRHTFVWVRVHLVWSTYRRQKWIDRSWQERLHRCLGEIGRRKGALVLAVGGARDHVHLYVSLSPTMSVAASAFSVCKRCETRVIAYVRNQEARHGPAREGGVHGT